jgi:uncharacterized protein
MISLPPSLPVIDLEAQPAVRRSTFLESWRRSARDPIRRLQARHLAGARQCAEEVVLATAFREAERKAATQYFGALRREMGMSIGGSQYTVSTHADPAASIAAILIKPVSDRCNLRCTYCYEGVDSERYVAAKMSDELLRGVLCDVLARPRGPVQFVWHGGEPTLAGLEFFEQAMWWQTEFNHHRIPLTNSLQTNGTLLDEAWTQFFRRNRFQVGVSLDGPRDLHDATRIDAKGRGTFEAIVAAIRLLREHDVPFGAIAVVGEAHRNRAGDLFDTFRELGICSYDVHPNFGMGSHTSSRPLSPRDYADFMVELFDTWLSAGDPSVRISTFDDAFSVMSGEPPSACYYGGTCASIVAVESDGAVVPCTRPFDRTRYTFGNVSRASLRAIVASERYAAFRSTDRLAQSRSEGCRWSSMCHNGCPQHRSRDGHPDISGGSLYCECQSRQPGGNAAMWEYLFRRVWSVLFRDADAAPPYPDENPEFGHDAHP